MLQDPTPLDPAQLRGTTWHFYHESGSVGSSKLLLRADGGVGLYNHHNERFWRVDGGVLCFLDQKRNVSVRFNETINDAGGEVLRGAHIPDPNIMLCLSRHLPRHTAKHRTRTALARHIATHGWSVGEHSYGVPQFIEDDQARFHLGKYCSIAGGVKVSLGDHRVDYATTYPFATLRHFWTQAPKTVADHATKGDVTIGHDVWIATDVWIGSGVTIGSGAVIGAKAVVTKSVPPYAIVVGNPGRIARYRFDEATIRDLLDLAWWDLPDETVDSLLPLLLSADIQPLLSALRRIRATL